MKICSIVVTLTIHITLKRSYEMALVALFCTFRSTAAPPHSAGLILILLNYEWDNSLFCAAKEPATDMK